jgi:uncharacterized paraquat-inducible protein A
MFTNKEGELGMEKMKTKYLLVAFALAVLVLLAFSSKVFFVNVNATCVSGKMIADNLENANMPSNNTSFEPHIFMIAFLVMVGGALGIVLLNNRSQNKDSTENKTKYDDKEE